MHANTENREKLYTSIKTLIEAIQRALPANSQVVLQIPDALAKRIDSLNT